MKRLILMAALSALVLAKPKPETYRETEDFQYSRSSTDEGHKAGYYGAQRGNMGGNYERAHNMDLLAQHQMSGLVRQVDGELGEGAKTRTGSVYTAANSRGIYGSGHYDLTNLKGRNFAEGESKGNSQAYVAQTSQNSGYRGHSYSGMNRGFSSSSQAHDARYSGYQSSGQIDQRNIDNLQSVDASHGFGGYEHNNQAGYMANYHMQYGSHGQSEFDQSSTNLHRSNGYDANTRTRYITTPVKVVLRPSGRVAIPISAPTYSLTDAQTVLTEDKNAFNRDAEILTHQTNFVPTNKAKHYESSYSYRKQWEKHHTQPADVAVVVPTENPFPKNSELYDDEQLLQSAKDQLQTANLQTAHANINSEHRANTKSAASAQSTSQSAFNSHHSQSAFNAQQSSASSDSYANAYGHSGQKSGMTADLTNAAVENLDLKPKSYHSSYSYHKSWERQGDPYVIKPSSSYDGESSQRLTAASANGAAYSSHHYGSHSKQAHQTYIADCDDEGHIRVARSSNSDQILEQQQQNQWEDLTQQTQGLERLEDLGQHTQSISQNLEDFGQQQQNLEYLGQQTQNQWDNLQELGQETQNHWDSLQPLGQKTENKFDNLQQLEQQSQNKWNNLEDLGQQTQSVLEQNQNGNLEDFSQQSQKEDTLINFEQQNTSEDTVELGKNYTQQEGQLNTNTWDQQIAGFQPQTNAPNTYDNNNANKVNSENFARPISEFHDNTEHNPQPHPPGQIFATNDNEKPNLFETSINNKEYKTPWEQNNENIFWNSNLHQNTDKNFMSHFWHMNENNNFKEHNFNFNSYSASESGSQIQSLWNKIDSIAGEISATEVNTQNNDFHQHDFFSNNRNHKQNDFDWSNTSGLSNLHTVYTGNNKNENSEHHNLFDEQIHIESTSVKSNIPFLTHGDTGLNTNPISPDDTHDYKTPNLNENVHHSSDEGRGDIGPEETLFDFSSTSKPYKTQEELDILSLTKENSTKKPKDIIVQPSIFKNKYESTDSTLTVLNMSTNENKNRNTQNELSNNSHFGLTSTTPVVQIGIKPKETTPKYNSVFQAPKPQEQTADSLETSKEQQNLEQQFEDFDQQLQGSWFSNDNLQHGYDQQNVEQPLEAFHHENNKPYKTAEEIETLSLAKETVSVKPNNVISPTTSIIQIITTPRQPTTHQKPFVNVIEIDNPSPYVQKHKSQIEMAENVETDMEQKNVEQQLEAFDQQLQGSWFSGDNLQQAYDQQNIQQFQVFNKFENEKLYKTPEEIETVSLAKERSGIKPNNVESLVTDIPETPENVQQQTLQQKSEDLQQIPVKVLNQQNTEEQFKVIHRQSNSEAIPSTTETQTEKPGFWKSVGSKFSNAKEKVVSWFKSI